MRNQNESLGFIIGAGLLAVVSLYFFAFAQAPRTAGIVAIFAIAAFAASLMDPPRGPFLEIDNDGIFDPRLGIGKIFWKEVRDFYVEDRENNRFLCLQVERPERFMMHVDRLQRERMKLHHAIGFRRINIDMSHVNISIQDLHRRIETRMERVQ